MLKLETRQRNAFAAKGITGLLQIRRWFPIRYIDNSSETGLGQRYVDKHVTIIGIMRDLQEKDAKKRSGKYLLTHVIDRKTGLTCTVMMFGASWRYNVLSKMIGKDVIVGGKLSFHPVFGYSISAYDVFSDQIAENMKVSPVFPKVKGISEKKMIEIVCDSIAANEKESIPPELLAKHSLIGINEAVQSRMFPTTLEDEKRAEVRLLYDDMMCLAGHFILADRECKMDGITITKTQITEKVIQNLPFQLTKGQMDTYCSIRDDMLRGKHIKALVQGDVGCGKTIISFLAMILMCENGYQSAIMAPTKILATQHYEKLIQIVQRYDMRAILIAGKKPTKEELKKIQSGEYQFIVGTQGILSENVQFHRLGLLVIDEEHKFGVAQRDKLEEQQKSINSISMSATPIPRTLANVIYGNTVRIYNITTKPNGRKPVITQYSDGRNIADYIRPAITRHEQIYVVCPAIDMDEKTMPDVMTVEKALQQYRAKYPDLIIEGLTGEMNPSETDKVLEDFRSGKTNILISTTVVEVGVDVPNATIIIIHNAERFGLAGMHQLRGRVGRGDKQSYCLLISAKTPAENERIQALCNTNDGFVIAKLDLKMFRKSGDLFGDMQSGYNKYVDEMLLFPQIYQAALEDCKGLSDDQLRYHIRKTLLADTNKNKIVLLKEFTTKAVA